MATDSQIDETEQLLFKYLYVQAKEGWYMTVVNKRAERERRQQTFLRPVRMAGIIHRSGMSVLQLCRFQRLHPPFSSLLTWCALSKGFSCSWKRCYGCLEQKIKDHLLFIKQIFKTFEEANRGTFSCVLFSAA